MRVLFIHCATEGLGVGYLSSALKNAGHDCRLLYEPMVFRSFRFNSPLLCRDDKMALAKKAVSQSPGLVAFSVESDYYFWALGVAAEIKKLKDIPVVFGGVHVSCAAEKVICRDCIDYLCIGEGEIALPKLCEALSSGMSARGIENIWYKEQGRVVKNLLGRPVSNLDSLDFPDKGLFFREYPGFVNSVYSIISARGCPNSCTYCYNSALKKIFTGKEGFYRRRSVGNVIEELVQAKARYGFKRVSFCDDLFTVEKDWLMEFKEQYRSRVALPFYCAVHPSFIDKEKVGILRGAGCSVVNLGIQTISEDMRRGCLNRAGTNAQIREAIKLFMDAGIFLFTNYIFGLPGQDFEELKRTALFCIENKADFHDINWLRYYPSTAIVDIARDKALLSARDVEKIDEAQDFLPYAHGGHSFSKERARIRNFIFLANFLPAGFAKFCLKKSLYSFLPVFNMRNPLVAARIIYKKYFCARRNPYPNFSIKDSLAYFLHYSLISKLSRTVFPRALVLYPRSVLRRILSSLRLAGLFTPRSFLRYASYFFKRNILRRKIPGTAIIALTFDCQCRCGCCSAGIFRRYFSGGRLMDLARIKERIDEAASLGVPRIHFTGGEPTLRHDIADIVSHASQKGIITFLETNGLLLDEGLVIRLKDAGLSSVNISLDSADALEHDTLRYSPGCFDKAARAVQLCLKHRQRCMLSVYATRQNIDNGGLSRLIKKARAMGCFGVRVIPAVASGEWLLNPQVLLSRDDVNEIERILPLTYPVLNRTRLIKCPMHTGYKVFILPDASIAPCEHLPFIFKDSQQMPLSQVAERVNSYEMFRGGFFCLPRDMEFRSRYLEPAVKGRREALII